MKSKTTIQFRNLYADLPPQVRQQGRTAYKQFKEDPWHPSLRFKLVHPNLPIYSARVSKNYRAVGVRNESGIIWFWIGTHADYDKLLSQL